MSAWTKFRRADKASASLTAQSEPSAPRTVSQSERISRLLKGDPDRTRLVLVSLLSLTLLWLFPIYEMKRSEAFFMQESRQRTELGVKALREFVESTEHHMDEVLLDLRDALRISPEAFENRVQQRMPFLNDLAIQVLVANAKGEQTYSSVRRNAPMVSVADRSYFRRFAQSPVVDDLNISEPMIGRVSGRWSVQFTRPLMRDGQFDGTLTIAVNPSLLTSELASRFGFDGMIAEVWRPNGQLLSRAPENVAWLSSSHPVDDWLMPSEVFKQSPLDGKEYLCNRLKSGPSQMTFVACETRERVLQDLPPLQFRIIAVCSLLSLLLVAGIVAYMRGRRDRLGSRAMLELNQQLLASSQQVARLGDYVWDVDQQTLTSSANLNDILGFGDTTVLPGRVFFSLIADEDRESVRRALKSCAQEGKTVDVHFRWSATIFRPQLWLRLHGRAVSLNMGGDGGPRMCVAGIVKDVTDIKQREESLILAKAAADAANQAKFEFLATMSHELRTPIFGISAGMEIALRSAQLDERSRRSLQASLKSAKHLNQLVDDVLDFAKLDSHALRLDDQPFSVRQALVSVVDLFAERAAEKQLELCLDDSQLRDEWVQGDERRFRQIFFNLVGNSIKFTSTGAITLVARTESTATGETLVSVTVSDTGIGIPADQLKRLFSPFEQGSVQTGVRFGGTGLGLSISRQLAVLMKGEIGVNSEVGRGSHFNVSVYLPSAQMPLALTS